MLIPPKDSHPTPLDMGFWIDAGTLHQEGAFLRHLMMGLKSEGQQVTVIAPTGLDLGSLPTLGSRTLHYRKPAWDRLAAFSPMQRFQIQPLLDDLLQEPPDVLHVWGCADHRLIRVLTDLVPNMTLIVWCWDSKELFSPLMANPAVRHVVAASSAIAARLPQSFPLPVTVIHPGVYCEDTIACYDVPGQLPCLISLDPLSDHHIYEPILHACKKLSEAGAEFMFFAYDTGKDEYAIWQHADQLGLLDRLSFVPFQQEAEPLLLHGDVYIHVLPHTRVQYRTLDAMGRGLAVLSVANSAADYLVDNQTARSLKTNTTEAWYEALSEMIRDRHKTATIAKRGQQYVRENHSMGQTIEQVVSLARQAVGIAIPMAAS